MTKKDNIVKCFQWSMLMDRLIVKIKLQIVILQSMELMTMKNLFIVLDLKTQQQINAYFNRTIQNVTNWVYVQLTLLMELTIIM